MNATLQWFPLLPLGLVLSVGAALVAALALGSWLLRRKNVPRRWVFVFAALRLGMIAVFTMALLRPVLSLPRRAPIEPDALVLVDVSQSMGQASALGAATRLDEVRQALRASPAVQSAARSHALHWFTFDRRAYPVEADALDEAQPRGEATDLAASLASALQHVELLNAASGAHSGGMRVLLASDGLDQGASDVVAAARELGVVVDILAPASGAARPRPAATIVDVQSARRVLLGSETAFQVALHADGATDGLSLVLEEDGREVHRRPVAALAAGQETRLVLAYRPEEPGLKRYTLRLAKDTATVGDPRPVNVQVTDQRYDVLLLEDTWRWDFKYLHRILEDDPSFSCTAFLSRGGTAFVQFGEPERRVQLGGFPRSRRELDGFDALILGDVDPRTWPRGLARHLAGAVTEGGKSLVVIAGPNLANWDDVAELTRLLPVELTRESGEPVSGQIDLRVTPEGKASSLFVLTPAGDDLVASASTDGPLRLPPLERVYPVLRKRPAATVLLESATNANEYGPLIVMAEHTVGRGQVLFIGTDNLWRWQTLGPRNEAGVTLYGAFWQQALRALAPPDLTSSPNQLWLRPERTLYRAGDRVRLSAEWRSDRPDAAAVTSTVVLPDGRRIPLDLLRDPKDPRHLSAQFDVAQAGQYRIEATAGADAQLLADTSTVIEAVGRRAETDEAPVDDGLLRRLAAATGGRAINPGAADGWLPAVPATTETVVKRQSFDLWRNFSLLLVLCVLLAADWSLRLFRGYV